MQHSLLAILLAIVSYNYTIAQHQHYDKLQKLYDKGQYDNCLKKAERYADKDPLEPEPLIYAAMCNYQLYLNQNQSSYLIKAMIEVEKAKKKPEAESCLKAFAEPLKLLQQASQKQTKELFEGKSRKSAKPYANMLVRAFEDTTEAYLFFYPPPKPKEPQIDWSNINKRDKEGRKQGTWKKIYSNGNLAYEITFKDDKPIGDFKRYHTNGKLQAHLIYNETSDYASAKLYNEKGKLLAIGFYKGQKKDSVWYYISTNRNLAMRESDLTDQSIKVQFGIAKEVYSEGIPNGIWERYYPDGQVIERINWKMGKREGTYVGYYYNGKKMEQYTFVDNERHGKYYLYDLTGNLLIKGNYANDKRQGEWLYKEKNGQEKILKYDNGILLNKDANDSDMHDIIKQAEQERNKHIDPEDYKERPWDYKP